MTVHDTRGGTPRRFRPLSCTGPAFAITCSRPLSDGAYAFEGVRLRTACDAAERFAASFHSVIEP